MIWFDILHVMTPKENDLKCVVSGSFFKFKPEIDRAIDNFTELGVTVLAPDKGWLYIPPQKIFSASAQARQFRPLPSERGMSVGQIEHEFLTSLSNSDFVYVVNLNGYVGEVVAMEIGVAMALGVPIYSQEPISPILDADPTWKERVSQIPTLSIEEVVKESKK